MKFYTQSINVQKRIMCVILVFIQLFLLTSILSTVNNAKLADLGSETSAPVILDFYNASSPYYSNNGGMVNINKSLISYTTTGGTSLSDVSYDSAAKALKITYTNADNSVTDPQLNIQLTEYVNRTNLPYVRVKMRSPNYAPTGAPILSQIYFKSNNTYLYAYGESSESTNADASQEISVTNDNLVINQFSSGKGVDFNLSNIGQVKTYYANDFRPIDNIRFDGIGKLLQIGAASHCAAIDGLILYVDYIGFFENEAQANAWDEQYSINCVGPVFDFSKQPQITDPFGNPTNSVVNSNAGYAVSAVTNTKYQSGWSALCSNPYAFTNVSDSNLTYYNGGANGSGMQVNWTGNDPYFWLSTFGINTQRNKYLRIDFFKTDSYDRLYNFHFMFSDGTQTLNSFLSNSILTYQGLQSVVNTPGFEVVYDSGTTGRGHIIINFDYYRSIYPGDVTLQYIRMDICDYSSGHINAGFNHYPADTGQSFRIYDLAFCETREAADCFEMRENDTSDVYSIKIKTLPKTSYNIGEAFSAQNLQITANRVVTAMDGTTSFASDTVSYNTDDFLISGYNPNYAGEQLITVSYKGCTAVYKVVVRDTASTSLNIYMDADFRDGNAALPCHVGIQPLSSNISSAYITNEVPAPYYKYTGALTNSSVQYNYAGNNKDITVFKKNIALEAFICIPNTETKTTIVSSKSGFDLEVANGYLIFAANDYARNTKLRYKLDNSYIGEWIHIYAVSDGYNGRIYINGILEAEEVGMGNAHATQYIKIGSDISDNNNAYIGYVRVYNEIPSSGEDEIVSNSYNSRNPLIGSCSVSVPSTPYYTIYNEDIDKKDITFNEILRVGFTGQESVSVATDTSYLTISGYDKTDYADTQTVTASAVTPWSGSSQTATFTARVRFVESYSFDITHFFEKRYFVGEQFVQNEATVTLTYNDGTTAQGLIMTDPPQNYVFQSQNVTHFTLDSEGNRNVSNIPGTVYLYDPLGYTFSVQGSAPTEKYKEEQMSEIYIYYGVVLKMNIDNGAVVLSYVYPDGGTATETWNATAEKTLPSGTKVTLNATPNINYQFAYFTVNNQYNRSYSDRIVSNGSTYSFVLGSDTTYTAQFSPLSVTTDSNYLDRSNEIFATTVNDSTALYPSIEGILPRYRTGAAGTLYSASLYKGNKSCTVSLDSSGVTLSASGARIDVQGDDYFRIDERASFSVTVPYDTQISLSTAAISGAFRFSCWTINGKTVGYSPVMDTNVTGDITVTAVYEQNPEISLPTVSITEKGSENSRVYLISERAIPTDYVLIESGIMISADSSKLENITNVDLLDENTSVGGEVIKIRATDNSPDGIFRLMLAPTYSSYKAAAYLIWQDIAGNVNITVSDVRS